MKLKKAFAAMIASTALLVACSSSQSSPQSEGTAVESPDAWAEADLLAAGASPGATAVAGVESGPAVVTDEQVGPGLSSDWEMTEGHLTIVGYDETQ